MSELKASTGWQRGTREDMITGVYSAHVSRLEEKCNRLTAQLEKAKEALEVARNRLESQEDTLSLNLKYALHKADETLAEINKMEGE